MVLDIVQLAVVLAVALLIVIPLGMYMAAVFMGHRTWLDPVLDPVDNVIYRLGGVDRQGMHWQNYIKAMMITNGVMMVIVFVVLETQQWLPLNPDGQGPINPWLAFCQAISFVTNTDWQNYGGENTFSYLSQMFGLIFPMFTSAATGLACGVAFIRGLAGSEDLGNFYVDLTRAITRIMMPIALVFGVLFVAAGVPATFNGAETVSTLNGPLAPAPIASPAPAAAASTAPSTSVEPTPVPTPSATSQGQQVISRGPVAALSSIKHLGTNGGGWFNANSAHPFENPTPLTNALEFLLMGWIPIAIIFMLGEMINHRRQAYTFFAVMGGLFIMFLAIEYLAEAGGNPELTNLGLGGNQGAMSMEGKEVRFGLAQTSLFVTATTAFTTGTVDAMHESLTPMGSFVAFCQMFLQMVFGGKGVGFITLIIFTAIAVFVTGLMVGRTPEFLGKKIESHEVKLASLAFLIHPVLILGLTSISLVGAFDLS